MTAQSEPTGTLELALAHAAHLLASDAAGQCIEQVAEILKVVPGEPNASLMLGIAQRILGRSASAVEVLRRLVVEQPYSSAAQYELGVALAEAGQVEQALAAWQQAIELKPDHADAWRAISTQLRLQGDIRGAEKADAEQVRASTRDPQLLAAGVALCNNELPQAETLLRAHLKRSPGDVAAIRMFAEVAGRLGRYQDAEQLLQRCLEIAPGFQAARYDYAVVLNRQGKAAAAVDEVERLLALEPCNPGYRNLQAVILAKIGDLRESIRIYAELLAVHSRQAKIWISYGHVLAAAGEDVATVAAYREAVRLTPGSGEAWWSLANLKTFRFADADLAAVDKQLARTDLPDTERVHFHFAAGKAREDRGEFAVSFEHYATGNRLRRAEVHFDGADHALHIRRSKSLFTAEFFAARVGHGCVVADPIFIVGLPRAGSTLIEQILASHPAVEGTAELPDIISLARSLSGRRTRSEDSEYPDALAALSAVQCRELGEQYLARTRIQRRSQKLHFVDKMPNNFLHIGLIQLALPKARIIDARRNPLACCLSAFKQYFANGQNYTYSLTELGLYYRGYVDLMRHIDGVLPGRVHRVIHERLVDDTEAEVRRLLEYCGLPFDARCLQFHENTRAVRTASSQQVRRPINRDGLDHWRNFEPWLDELKAALGPDVADYSSAA